MMRLWWKLKLWHYTRKARFAKAVWLARKETIKPKGGRYCSIATAESAYCQAVVRVKTYHLLLNPEIPVANVIDVKEAQ